eukprot:scaffold234569_cov19-Prasinocladus_malaysianus.AAC.1
MTDMTMRELKKGERVHKCDCCSLCIPIFSCTSEYQSHDLHIFYECKQRREKCMHDALLQFWRPITQFLVPIVPRTALVMARILLLWCKSSFKRHIGYGHLEKKTDIHQP